MAFGPERLAAALSALEPGWQSSGFCVAFSGGLDSSALLHAMAALRADYPGLRVRAVHVDHGLQSQAPAWAESCTAFCQALELELQVLRLALEPAAGESVEAEARNARYSAITGILKPGEWLLTAHHRDDQLETVLIQLLRGAGVAGLAAMPALARLARAGMDGRYSTSIALNSPHTQSRKACPGSLTRATARPALTAAGCANRCCRSCGHAGRRRH